jgi:hypothetical protein
LTCYVCYEPCNKPVVGCSRMHILCYGCAIAMPNKKCGRCTEALDCTELDDRPEWNHVYRNMKTVCGTCQSVNGAHMLWSHFSGDNVCSHCKTTYIGCEGQQAHFAAGACNVECVQCKACNLWTSKFRADSHSYSCPKIPKIHLACCRKDIPSTLEQSHRDTCKSVMVVCQSCQMCVSRGEIKDGLHQKDPTHQYVQLLLSRLSKMEKEVATAHARAVPSRGGVAIASSSSSSSSLPVSSRSAAVVTDGVSSILAEIKKTNQQFTANILSAVKSVSEDVQALKKSRRNTDKKVRGVFVVIVQVRIFTWIIVLSGIT